jgi:pimeloyl-ACP methyl ester carboxylesterase
VYSASPITEFPAGGTRSILLHNGPIVNAQLISFSSVIDGFTMSDSSPATQTFCSASPDTACNHSCAGSCEARAMCFDEVLRQFEAEAVRGTCATGRYRMPYFVWGNGPPLVFIHGVADSSYSFLLPVSRLSKHFRCIGYDLPTGHGDGARLWRYSHAALVEDFWALVDHLQLPRTYVFGASFGSTVALRALRERPERLPRAVLQGGLAHRPLRRAELVLARLGRFVPGSMALVPGRDKLLHKVNGAAFAARDPAHWRAFIDWTAKARIAAFAHQALWLHNLDLRSILPEIRQPVLLVVGDQDRVVPPSYTDVLHQGLPSAGKAVLSGCGHLPAYTHPEALAELVRQFLTPPA